MVVWNRKLQRLGREVDRDHGRIDRGTGTALMAKVEDRLTMLPLPCACIALMPLYARNLLPSTVVSRPLAGVAPTIDLSLGYNEANRSPLLKTVVSRIGELKFARR
jgi:hypothetical protein